MIFQFRMGWGGIEWLTLRLREEGFSVEDSGHGDGEYVSVAIAKDYLTAHMYTGVSRALETPLLRPTVLEGIFEGQRT